MNDNGLMMTGTILLNSEMIHYWMITTKLQYSGVPKIRRNSEQSQFGKAVNSPYRVGCLWQVWIRTLFHALVPTHPYTEFDNILIFF